MKILFINAYYYPEEISFTHLERDLIDGLIAAKHEIFVICPTPTRGVSSEIARKYRSIKTENLYDGKVSVRRFWAPQERKNKILRTFRYIWCNVCEYQIGGKYTDIDAIFAVSTPPTQGLLAGILGKKLQKPVIYSLQDVFPDSLVTTGITQAGSITWKIGRRVEDITYLQCDKIITISNAIKNNLLKKGVVEKKIEMIPNWIDTQAVKPIARVDNRLFEEYGIDPHSFVVVYAGNLGAAQGADIIINAADILRYNNEIVFVIFGSGSEYETIKKMASDRRLPNILINPLLPRNRVSEVYSLGDVALIICKPGVGTSGMPSKALSIMACNTPIIASFDMESDLSELISHANAGLCVEAGNVAALVEAVLKMHSLRQEAFGYHIRECLEETISKRVCIDKYCHVFGSVLERIAND